MRACKYAMMVAVSAGLLAPLAASAATLVLRNGWDPVNNAADPVNGYTGTRDDAGVNNVYTPENLSDNLYAGLSSLSSGTVVGFDLSQYASQVGTLNSATLQMTFSSAPWFALKSGHAQATFVVRDPTAQWIEGQVTFYRPQYSTDSSIFWNAGDPWNTTAGITMQAQAAVDSVDLGENNTAAGYTGYTVSFNVTSLATDWLSNAANNRGAAVTLADMSINADAYWAGKDNAMLAYRPTLVLDYAAVPEPAGAILAGLGLAALALRRRRPCVG